ncbi:MULTISPECIES: hypothetical protein [unclassified Dysgonomonas]|uniref:hypothetical protein n=1 Tax=unclassified Dysgonomonas TaxID=2630389 RepID=UPI0013ED53E1|nr:MULTISPECIES: hypothetical protein [unclassified Dysgonomonas]
MKKRILGFLMIATVLIGCNSVQKELTSAYNITKCEYSYKSISGIKVSGMNLSNGVSITQIPKITSILSGNASSIPLDFTLNLNIKNPNESAAILHGLQYVISIDDIEFTKGAVNETLNIAAGESQSLPLNIGVDLATLARTNSQETIVEIAKNFVGIGSQKSNVSVKLKPTFMIGNTPITSPTYFPVNFSFGGGK